MYPSLADHWTLSDDGLTYTFTLRDGFTFSDGSPLEADDVRRSWLRLLDPATHSHGTRMLVDIRGASERSPAAARTTSASPPPMRGR